MKSWSCYAHWFLRIALASIFLYHGLSKFPQLNGFASTMHLPFVIALLVALMETTGAILIVIGGFSKSAVTRLGVLFIIPIMLVAIFKVHWGQWSFIPTESHPLGGIEFQTTILHLSIYLLMKGNTV